MRMNNDPVDAAEKPDVRYERSDANVRAILMAGLGLIVLAAVMHVSLWWLFEYLAIREVHVTLPPSPLADQPGAPQPPEPRLQASPGQDLQAMRAEEDALLSSYGWVDQQAGIVRLPIERAMQLLAERGLPVRTEE